MVHRPRHAACAGNPERVDPGDNAGTGTGMSFACALIGKTDDSGIGLIAAAVGGVPISTYAADGKLYLCSMEMTRQAEELLPVPSQLRAILWLQGESDATSQAQVDAYEARLLDLMDRYLSDLQDPYLPFIVCPISAYSWMLPRVSQPSLS